MCLTETTILTTVLTLQTCRQSNSEGLRLLKLKLNDFVVTMMIMIAANTLTMDSLLHTFQ